ncbi:MAG: hypothetical protein NZ561_03930 [Phycisphaerae bacterium]|nr:hypothetical protein [Phycisphaerae bacterium]MDW8262136.1 hypothetical protein [Phycisphaerales bacterium]
MKGRRGLIDCRNNVIYNTGGGSAYGGEECDLNFVGNYLRAGPNTQRPGTLYEFWGADTRAYFAGNLIDDGNATLPAGKEHLAYRQGSAEQCLVDQPFETPLVQTDPAERAFQRVLRSAGATLPRRDAVDRRIVAEVTDRIGRIIDSQAEVGGWPELQSAPAPPDADHDGMPDDWETARGLDPNDPADGRAVTPAGYTNLEHYLNELAAAADLP